MEGRDDQNPDGFRGLPVFAVCWGQLAVLLLLGALSPGLRRMPIFYRKSHKRLVISEGNPGRRASWLRRSCLREKGDSPVCSADDFKARGRAAEAMN